MPSRRAAALTRLLRRLCRGAARLRAAHCALLTCADAPRLFARLRASAAAGRALRALGIMLLSVGLLIYYGARAGC
jgi:uncharacterized protein YjeT (DUF2065 family)